MTNDYRKIKNPDYAESQERMNTLRNMVIDGKDAEAVIKYAEIFMKECEEPLVKYAAEGKMQLMNEAALEYRVACKFMEMLKHAADIGKAKEERLRQLRTR